MPVTSAVEDLLPQRLHRCLFLSWRGGEFSGDEDDGVNPPIWTARRDPASPAARGRWPTLCEEWCENRDVLGATGKRGVEVSVGNEVIDEDDKDVGRDEGGGEDMGRIEPE